MCNYCWLLGQFIKIWTEDLQEGAASIFQWQAFAPCHICFIFLTGNPVWKCIRHVPVLVSGSTPSPSPPMTSLTPHCVSACLGHSLGHNLDISYLNNAVVIRQTPLSVSSPWVCRGSRVILRCDRCLSGTMHLSPCACTHAHCVWLIETDALCIWAFRECECVWQTVNQPVMRGNRTVDRSISYFLRRQTEEKHYCSPGKWFAFHRSFISLILLVSLSFHFFLTLHSSPLWVSLSPSPLWIWLFGCLSLLISPPACLIRREVEIQPIRAE